MSKSTGPYFEFVMRKDGARVEFVFLPGNVSKKVFNDTANALETAFKNQYGVSASEYVRPLTLEDGTKTIAINQTKTLVVLKMILETPIFRDFKLKVTGVDKSGNEKTKIINNSVEKEYIKEIIPYHNKSNNDMTTRRS